MSYCCAHQFVDLSSVIELEQVEPYTMLINMFVTQEKSVSSEDDYVHVTLLNEHRFNMNAQISDILASVLVRTFAQK